MRSELLKYGLFARKRLGQHFLVDPNILNKVVRAAELGKEDVVLEVGPGLGGMTLALAREAKKVIAIEIDPKLATILREKIVGQPNVEIVEKDILQVDFRHLLQNEAHTVKVVANLPYQISTPVLFRFMESKRLFSTFTLMLQREVAERMVAPPGRKEYGPLTVFVRSFLEVSIRFFVKPSAFFPPPKVDSAVIHMHWKERPAIEPDQEEWFKKIVKSCFGYRRKTLINALRHSELSLPEAFESKIEKIGINPRRRPETLSIHEFVILAETLKS